MLQPLLLAAAVLLAAHLYSKLRHYRLKQFANLPQLPRSLLWGHLKVFGELLQKFPADCHPDYVFEEMHRLAGHPPLFFIDLWPLIPPMVILATHDLCEQAARSTKTSPYSLPKSPTVANMRHAIGASSLIIASGERWKALRRRFNPGFAPAHIWSTGLPLILDRMPPFVRYLDQFAHSGEPFPLGDLIVNLTLDMIGAVALGAPLDAQHLDRRRQGQLVRLFGDSVRTYTDDKNDAPWWLAPRMHLRRRILDRRVDAHLAGLIRQRFATLQQQTSSINQTQTKGRSVLDLSLEGVDRLTPAALRVTSHQLRSFLFGGHDTTSALLAWIVYELARTPRCLAAVRAELHGVLGPATDPESVIAKLNTNGETLLQRMPYVAAVVKEALRLHPPASSARWAGAGSGFVVATQAGQEYALDGCVVVLEHHLVHRDRGVWGDTVEEFRPERFLGEAARDVPATAWRAFERGPRNCIGVELANIEARAVVAVVARRYEFTKVGLGELERDGEGRPVLEEGTGQYRVKSELYNTRQVTSKPVDMTMRVRFASGAER